MKRSQLRIAALITVLSILFSLISFSAYASADNVYIIYKNEVKEKVAQYGLYQPQEVLSEYSRSRGWYNGMLKSGLAAGYICDFDGDWVDDMILCFALEDPDNPGKFQAEVIGYQCEYSEVKTIFDFIIKSEHPATFATFDLLKSADGRHYASLRDTYDANNQFDCWGTIFNLANPSIPLKTYTSLSSYSKNIDIGAGKPYMHMFSLARGVFDGGVGFDTTVDDFMNMFNEKLPQGYSITYDDFYYHDKSANVTVNGKVVEFGDAKPVIVNGRVIVPLRAIAEALGCEVVFHPDLNCVQLFYGGNDYTVGFDTNELWRQDGSFVWLDAACVLMEGTTYVPLTAFGHISGSYVNWDSKTDTAEISATPVTPVPRPVATIVPTPVYG